AYVIAAILALGATTVAQAPRPQPSPRTPPPPVASAPTPAPTGPAIAITNARIMPVSGAPIERGTVLIRGGRIAAVGATVQVPAGARTIDAAGKIVTPGLIESATQIGIVEIQAGAEGTDDQSSTDKELSAAFNVVD